MTSVQPVEGRTLASDDPRLTIIPLDDEGLRLVGEIDIATLDELERALRPLAATHGDVHLDLRDLTFIDVAGVGLLAEFAARLHDAHLVLHHPPYLMRRMVALLWSSTPQLEVRPQ